MASGPQVPSDLLEKLDVDEWRLEVSIAREVLVATKKKITRSQMIGDAAVALIARRVGEMGFVWYPHGTEAGIDGHLELRDAASEEMLAGIVLVQSKGSERPFVAEDDRSFTYVVDGRDLEYWLAANAPVMLVCSHPSRQQAWWKCLGQWFTTPERIATRRVVFDKEADRLDASAAPAIAALTHGPHASVYLGPPPKREKVRSNLLTIDRWPERVYSAPARVASPREAWVLLREASEDPPRDWRLHDGLLHSFVDLRHGPLQALIDGDVTSLPSREWAFSDDPQDEHAFIELLGRTVQQAFASDLAWHRERKFLYFRATDDMTPRIVRGARERQGVTVFQPYHRRSDPSQVGYYRHWALKRRFLRAGDAWFMTLVPTYHFTFDGHRESYWAADQLAGIKRRERNEAVRRQVDTWARFLRRHAAQDTLFPSQERTVTFGALVDFDVEHGIHDRAWERPAKLGGSVDGADRLFEAA